MNNIKKHVPIKLLLKVLVIIGIILLVLTSVAPLFYL